jgi:hypothetical protein
MQKQCDKLVDVMYKEGYQCPVLVELCKANTLLFFSTSYS